MSAHMVSISEFLMISIVVLSKSVFRIPVNECSIHKCASPDEWAATKQACLDAEFSSLTLYFSTYSGDVYIQK